MSVVVQLKVPVKAHGEMLSALTFREPTVSDTLDLGMPMAVDTEGDSPAIFFRTPVIAKYVVRLASVQMNTVKALCMEDWLACQGVIQGFFGRSEDAETSIDSPTEPSSLPTSGEQIQPAS